VNPFKIDGAGSFGARSRARTEVIEEHDLMVITSTIGPEWRAMVALAFGRGLRFGEIIALRRSDIDLKATPPVVRVTRAVGTGQGGRRYEKGPKSTAGTRESAHSRRCRRRTPNTCGRTSQAGTAFSSPRPDGSWLSEARFRQASAWRRSLASRGSRSGAPPPREQRAIRLKRPSGGRMSTKSRCSLGTARPKRPSAT
jgi:integrase